MKRRKFIYQTSLGLGGLVPLANQLSALDINIGPYFATGIKIGEVTASEAIVWVRLTKDTKPVPKTAPIPQFVYLDEANGEWHPVAYFKEKYKQDRPDRETKAVFPDGYTVNTIEGAVPGTNGDIRILYRKKGESKWNNTDWKTVDPAADFCTQVKLKGLQAGTDYDIKVEVKSSSSKNATNSLMGSFATASLSTISKDVHFMVTTCHEYDDQDDRNGMGFKIYKHMQMLQPDFMVHTGDVVYYDQKAKDIPLAHWHWQRMFGLEGCKEFYKQVPTYFLKDDHDTWMNDCDPQTKTRFMGKLTFEQGVKIFSEQVPMSEKPFRTFRWGKDLQIWLPEGREYRSKNNSKDGPDKSIWGKEQMQWFKDSFNRSDATYKIIVSATPIVGPDRPQKNDNHANSGFAYEGAEIRKFIAGYKNVYVICGDRHWQYASKDKKTGLMEFACGPASDEHAGGWKKEDILPEHRYLNIVGGFLGVEIKPGKQKTAITFTHYSVDGKKLHIEDFTNEV